MGLFDRIKDNARDLSMKAIEATREEIDDSEQKRNEPTATVTDAEPVEPVQEPAEVIDDPAFLLEETEPQPEEPEEPKVVKPAKKEEPKTEESEKPRHSKVIEISKTEYEESKKVKKAEETKQAAKERLAKSYTPSYKTAKPEDKSDSQAAAPAPKKPARTIPVGIIDITPGKFTDPTKQALYARERAALNVIASRRKLDGSVPLYVASHMNFKTRVFIDRIEYSGSFGKTKVPISQVAWIKLRATGTGIIIETTEGKRLVMVVKSSDRLAFADAVLKVQSMQPKKGKFKDTKTVRIDELDKFTEGVDEIEKLAKLFDKGILSQEEFDTKKKQILGI